MNTMPTTPHALSKSQLMMHRQCAKRLWLQVHRPDLSRLNESNQARLTIGTNVGTVARKGYPDGVLIDGADLTQAVIDTQVILAGEKRPVFEATFQSDGLLIRADLLLPEMEGFRMVEVKSSTTVKDYHLSDAAIQCWVAQQAQLPLTGVEIANIDSSFVYRGKGDYQGLFRYTDVSAQITELTDGVPDWIAAAHATLSGTEPCIAAGAQCATPFECPYADYCSPPIENGEAYPPELLPYSAVLAAELRAEGYTDLREVPEARLDNPRHQRIWRVSRSGQAELDPKAGKLLAALPYPRYYLDFETISLAVPVWAGTRPFMQVPFQWSCHIETGKGVMTQCAFLAEGLRDPRRPFAVSLINAVGSNGPVLVYNAPFERSRMQELAEYFPDLKHELHAVIDRLVDLLPIARDHYYHNDMCGSWSIKAVLPTIAPDLAYDNLEVANGELAQKAFAEIMLADTATERREQLRDSLLQYCERDTLAMVRIARYFEG
jgi:hypothetical protein